MASKEVLGTANYMAIRSPGTSNVELTAIGVLPCWNYQAKLVQRPERVFPPNWDMVFVIEDFCLTAVKPFQVWASMDAGNATSITVYDAGGRKSVPIYDPLLPVEDLREALSPDKYDVYALVQPTPSKLHVGCIIVPHGSLVIGIYYHAFGPASMDECLKWKDQNCARGGAAERGPEVPWPKRH